MDRRNMRRHATRDTAAGMTHGIHRTASTIRIIAQDSRSDWATARTFRSFVLPIAGTVGVSTGAGLTRVR